VDASSLISQQLLSWICRSMVTRRGGATSDAWPRLRNRYCDQKRRHRRDEFFGL